MIRHLPNLLTLGNLFCGCCALLFILSGRIAEAALFTAGCFVLDYADGLAARALGVASDLGRQLDSLADVVSFGVVPGALMYHMLSEMTCPNAWALYPPHEVRPSICYAALPGFVLTAFAALRLGKFNIDIRQTHYFLGLTTPATTVFVLGIALAYAHNRFGLQTSLHPGMLYALIFALSGLMNAELPMFGLKFGPKKWWLPLAFLVLAALMGIFLRELALSAVVVAYIGASLFLASAVVKA
jgi:CDP-diacylglycerol--serine O-phosphatidyltransferase